jgi:sporulation protein YlmC with PRC-barrel domain
MQEIMQEPKAKVYSIFKASTLIGNTVKNTAGENIGKIKEIMINLEEGCVVYAVLSFGGFLGIGNKLFAIPWSALILKPRENTFILNVDKERLKNSPGFNKNNWPDLADPRWSANPTYTTVINSMGERRSDPI